MFAKIAPYGKAVTGSVVAFLTGLGVAMEDGVVTSQEWVNIAVATVVSFGAVWAIPNSDHRDGRDVTGLPTLTRDKLTGNDTP